MAVRGGAPVSAISPLPEYRFAKWHQRGEACSGKDHCYRWQLLRPLGSAGIGEREKMHASRASETSILKHHLDQFGGLATPATFEWGIRRSVASSFSVCRHDPSPDVPHGTPDGRLRPNSWSALALHLKPGAQLLSFNLLELAAMRLSVWGYLTALALGSTSQFVKAPPWLRFALLFTACLIALLATFSFMRDKGGFSALASFFPRSRLRSPLVSAEARPPGNGSRREAPPAKAPRPAGPAGPVPVLQHRPQVPSVDTVNEADVTGPRPRKSTNG